MSPTEIQLLAIHRSPVVNLDDICEPYLNMKAKTARREAAANLLPFPAFKIAENKFAPWGVKLSALAEYIDSRAEKAEDSWKRSQL